MTFRQEWEAIASTYSNYFYDYSYGQMVGNSAINQIGITNETSGSIEYRLANLQAQIDAITDPEPLYHIACDTFYAWTGLPSLRES